MSAFERPLSFDSEKLIMAKRKATSLEAAGPRIVVAAGPAVPAAREALVSGPRLRALLGVSAVTLWRWRHDPAGEFPAASVINKRLYWEWGEIADWLDRRAQAA